jgi:hypothetical protein
VTIPVAIYLLSLWGLHYRPQPAPRFKTFLIPIFSLIILLTSFAGALSSLWTGILLVLLLGIKLSLQHAPGKNG